MSFMSEQKKNQPLEIEIEFNESENYSLSLDNFTFFTHVRTAQHKIIAYDE
jgi:hypothetical protein